MRASKDFILREVAGESLLVPTGAAAARINGLITLNELGCFIFKTLQTEQTPASIAAQIAAEYDVAADAAEVDTLEFLQQLREIGALDEQ